MSSISTNMANCVMKCSILSNTENVKMAYFNARSLNMDDKFAEFMHLIDGTNFHFIAITETWLKPWISSSCISIPDYALIRNDRFTHGGGVAIYIRKDLKWKIIDQSVSGTTEFLFVEVSVNKQAIVIGVIYNSKGKNVHVLEDILSANCLGYDDIIIAGDFNVNMLRCSTSSDHFKNVLSSQNLTYLPNDQPTYFSNFYSSSSLLDLILTRDSAKILRLVQLDLSLFDHDFICLSYSLPVPIERISMFQYRSYKDINVADLAYDCLNMDWESLFKADSVDNKISILNTYILELFDKHVPMKSFRMSKQTTPSWFDDEIVIAINYKEMCYKTWKHNKTYVNRMLFCLSRRRVKKLIRIAKSKFLSKLLDPKLAPRHLWNNIRKLGICKEPVATPDFSANDINSWFAVTTSSSIVNPNKIGCGNNSARKFSFYTIDEVTVKSAVLRIKSNSAGDDGIPLKFIKQILDYILPVLCYLINTCIEKSIFPAQWKISRIVPVAKCSNPKNMKDLRPISILPMLSKVMERIMCDQMIRYLETNNLISKLQSGFRAKHSTATALLKITDDISAALDNGHVALLVLLDFSKAFDTLNHSILLSKLQSGFNFSQYAIELIKNYLSGRSQYVSFNNEISYSIQISRGVPQGSILGPILFLLFINDIQSVIRYCNYHLYDDVQIYNSGKADLIETITAHVNADLIAISEWAKANNLDLNCSKSLVLPIYRGNESITYPPVCINGNDFIPFVNKARNLGFMMNSTLTWDAHVSLVCSNIYAGLKSLNKFKNATPIKTKKMLAHSLLMTHLTYADIVMGDLNYELNRTLNVAFNSITRYIFNLSRYDHITPFSKSFLGCTFSNYLKYRQCLLLFNIRYGNSVDYLYDKVRFSKSDRNLSFIIPRFETAFRAKSFFVCGAQTWNKLPLNIKRITRPHQFKQECFKYFSSI